MAYISNTSAETPDAASASFTPTLLPHVANDLIVLYVFQDGGGTDITTTAGWNKHGTFAASGGSRGGFFSKLAASSSETAPTFSGANDEWGCCQLIVKDADTSTPVEVVSSRVDYTTATSFSSATITTLTNNALLLYGQNNDGLTPCIPSPAPTELLLACAIMATTAGTASNMGCVGYKHQYTAGAVSALTLTKNAATGGGNSWVISIKNKSGGLLGPQPGGTTTFIEKLHGITAVNGSLVAPSTLGATINGLTADTGVGTIGASIPMYAPEWSLGFGGAATVTTDSSTTPQWSGPLVSLTNTVNLDGAVVACTWANTVNASASIGAQGIVLILADASLNYEAFNITNAMKYPLTTAHEFFINPSAATATFSSGTLDYTAIKYIGVIYHRTAASRAEVVRSFTNYGTGKVPYTILGGSASAPCSPTTISNQLTGWGQGSLRSPKQGAGQVLLGCGIQLGDGSTPTYFQILGGSLEFPVPTTSASTLKKWTITDNAFAIQVYASASDTMDFRGGLLGTTAPMDFTIHASSSTSATYYWNGLVVSGPWDVTWKTGIAAQSITFTGCDEINFKGANVTSCYIQKTVSTDAAIAFDASGATVTSTTIDVTGTSAAYHLELGASVTSITLTDVTFTGTPGTDKVHVLKTSGTVTININGTTTLSAGDVTSAGATVDIVATPVYQTVTVSGATAGSRIQIYDTTNDEELYNGTPTFPYTWTDSGVAAGDRAIRLRVAYCSGTSAKKFIDANIGTCGQTAGTAAVAYLCNQEADGIYNTNAIDGSTVTGIEIDDSTDRVKINISGGSVTWASIYAYQVYWLSTSAGIADDGAIIDAPDTANYLVSDFQIKNIHASAALTITGGWGRDASTGLSADIIDVAGSTSDIFLAPDHVVAYSSGSGLTAGQDAKLSSIDSAVDSINSAVASYLDAAITSVAGQLLQSALSLPGITVNQALLKISDIKDKTDNLPSDPASNTQVNTRLAATSYTAPPSAATVASQVRTELATELGRVDAAVSSRLATNGYTAPDNGSISAIKAKTDNLPDSPAAVSDIPTASQNASELLGTSIGRPSVTVEEALLSGAPTVEEIAAGVPTLIQIAEAVDEALEAPCSSANTGLRKKVVELHQVAGLDSTNPVTASGDGIATKTLTVEGMTVTITPDGITRT